MIEKGQKYTAKEDERAHRVQKRTITVIDNNEVNGRILVSSHNEKTGTIRTFKIYAERLASSAYKLLPLVLLVLSGCTVNFANTPKKNAAEAQEQPKGRCQNTPQWFTKDEEGHDVGLFVCFGEKHTLLYDMRIMPPTPAPAAPEPKDAKATPPKAAKKKPANAATMVEPSASKLKAEYAANIRRGDLVEIERERKIERIQREVDRQRAAADRALAASRP